MEKKKKDNIRCFRCERFIFDDSVGKCKFGLIGRCNKFKEIGVCQHCRKSIERKKKFCSRRCYELWKKDWDKNKKLVLNVCPKCEGKLVRIKRKCKSFRKCEKCQKYFTFAKLIIWNNKRIKK